MSYTYNCVVRVTQRSKYFELKNIRVLSLYYFVLVTAVTPTPIILLLLLTMGIIILLLYTRILVGIFVPLSCIYLLTFGSVNNKLTHTSFLLMDTIIR